MLISEQLTFDVIGAAMAVHAAVGPGFLESVYQNGMQVELTHRRMSFGAQKRIDVTYRGVSLGEHILDLVVEGQVIVELKAVKELNDQHRAQVLSYLAAARLPVGLLINFAKPSLEVRRLVLTQRNSAQIPKSV